MNDTPDTPPADDGKTDLPSSATESGAGGGQEVSATPAAETTETAPAASPDAAGEGNAPVPDKTDLIPDSDPPVDDKIAKGKGDKARAATLGQVAAPKPKPAKPEPEAEPAPDQTVIRTRAFPGPLLAFGGRARRAGWGPGFEISAQNAGDRTGRKMKLMISGYRAGPIEWKPEHLADELVADDWEVVVANDQLDMIQALMNGEALPQ